MVMKLRFPTSNRGLNDGYSDFSTRTAFRSKCRLPMAFRTTFSWCNGNFVGKVRDLNLGDEVSSLYLEHYPAMTEKALREIVEQAKARWDIQRVSVIHRVGLYILAMKLF